MKNDYDIPTMEKLETHLLHEEFFNQLRLKEYARLDKLGHTYLDYTGGSLYSESQVDWHHEMLKENVFGNPHSVNPTSKHATQLVEEARERVLSFFNADDYMCIFTQNASNALKIVGECYNFGSQSHLLLLTDNHNSVNGIREYCMGAGGSYDYARMRIEDLRIDDADLAQKLHECEKPRKLFAFPAQSNVSGVKHDLGWIAKAKQGGWDVLLDAAAYVPTSQLNLQEYQPDFVSLSFYKMFGYPTGLGCLLVKKSSFSKLKKKWFAGGTVSLASAITPYHFLRADHERYENGTISYLDIPVLKVGIDYLCSIGMDRLKERVQSLRAYLIEHLKTLEHTNGQPQLDLLAAQNSGDTGGTLIMCFKNPDGSKIPFEKVEEMASAQNISIRSGCFCNPGLDETNHCLTSDELAQYFSSREHGDYYDMMAHLKKMRGATRVSVGIATVQKDLDVFIDFVKSLRDQIFIS